jgi:hypothetical protein
MKLKVKIWSVWSDTQYERGCSAHTNKEAAERDYNIELESCGNSDDVKLIPGEIEIDLPEVGALMDATDAVRSSLDNWMEIAEEHDRRDYDYEAMRDSAKALEALRSERPIQDMKGVLVDKSRRWIPPHLEKEESKQ